MIAKDSIIRLIPGVLGNESSALNDSFQDDLIAFNDGGLLGNILGDIYPAEMVVNCTNISARKCNYLDMCISIYRAKFRVILYDKRMDYSFKVISYPFLDGNVPKNLSYGIFISQLVRFAKLNTTFKGFLQNVKDIILKLSSQGFLLTALRKKFIKFYHSHLNIWAKFGIDIWDKCIHLFD